MHIDCQGVGCTVHCPLCPCRYFLQICKDFHVGPILSYKTELAMLVVGQCCSSQLASCCAAGFSILNSSTMSLGLNFEYLCVQGGLSYEEFVHRSICCLSVLLTRGSYL
jgi:hypothetical protein